jgi:hypothetical protein
VGTKAHGHGADNRLTIPETRREWARYYEKLHAYVVVKRAVGSHEVVFLVEPTRPDWFYPCSVDDICNLLSHCSPEILGACDFLVLRQPTRKQRVLCPVWGRAIFSYEIDRYSGAAIVIEAQDLSPVRWPRSIDPEQVRELERLRQDGHGMHNSRRGIVIQPRPDSMRNTALYRTLLHELGHHIDYKRSSAQDWSGKTQAVKEDFAHRYATELKVLLSQKAVLPFAPMVDDESLASDGLKREWFFPS